jgi:hypothetical protein
MDFQEFPKMARLSREIIITEKIDGTNAQICIGEDGSFQVGSRTRWITPENDNFGFAAWAYANKDELMQLGAGRHFGEWWGFGIQRGYGLKEKRLSLFNVSRWHLHGAMPNRISSADPRIEKYTEQLPSCVGLVPVLYQGHFSTRTVEGACNRLLVQGSLAAPGFQKPEGVVVFHTAANAGFKVTLEKDDEPKSKA